MKYMKMMKHFIPVLALVFALSCKKDKGIEAGNIVYEQAITDIKKNEPVLLTFSNSNNTAKVEWAINPTTQTTISEVGNTATITFGLAGTYTVTATAGSISAKYKVVVNNVEYNPYGSNFNMTASKLVNISNNEAIVFSVRNAQGSNISWSVYSQAYNMQIDSANQTASITFSGGGVGSVSASDGVNTQRRTVWVNDPTNSNPNEDTVSFIAGEKLLLTPSVETISGAKHLIIQAKTFNPYHCASDRILSFSFNDEYAIDYSGVIISPQPCSISAQPSCSNSFSNIPAGTHSFVINFGNKTFTGTLTVSSSGVYTFTWTDTSVINISPMIVQ